ncbi:ribonuclease H-like domain-containing protein [Gautieria morchelliformis]|nr:ribonuclease H-like domain-containing protein [Gautieria morchelliformis]
MALDEEPEIPSPSASFDAYQVLLQSAAVSATKAAIGLPQDISYHRSLDRKFGKRLDTCSDRILSITSQLLEYAEAGNSTEGTSNTRSKKGKGKRKLDSEEDIVDGFHSLVVDVMDQLLERTDTCLDVLLGRNKPAAIPINPQQPSTTATKAPRGRLDPSLAHASYLRKPQLLFRSPVDNTNAPTPWIPKLKCKHHAVVPLSQSISAESFVSSPHPYQYEITHLTPPMHLLNPPSSPTPPEPLASSSPVTYISHVSQLPPLIEAMRRAPEIAVDLEHHSYRSFAGFVCLMQISTRTQDWIVDCLDPEIREKLECLNEIFADPAIVKVFHGAESDIVWLQQDFNLYVVNLFDTYHATKVLDFPKHSLAALLEMFCDFTPDKRYQLADWRIRPLPDEMLVYARSDTHFLLYIYDHLRNALVAPRSPQTQSQHQTPLLGVLRRSADTALRTYVRETYDAIGGTGAGGWDSLSRKWNRSSGVGGDVQAAVFKAVHKWRDDVGRSEDESTRYVLPNHYIFRLSENPPQDLPALLGIFHPVPPVVRTRSLELLDVIKDAVKHAALQPSIETVPMIVTDMDNEVHAVDVGNEEAAGLWDRLRHSGIATAAKVAPSSALFGQTLPLSRPPPAEHSASSSSLFGPSLQGSASAPTNPRYRDVVARIHSTLVLAPSLTLERVGTAISSSEPYVKVSDQDFNAAAQAEIPYIPPAQRQPILKTDPNADDTIVVVGQRPKKRKRKGATSEVVDSPVTADPADPKKRKEQVKSESEGGALEPFDFDAAPNILDEPGPVAPPAKKRREKGAKTGVQYGNFGAPPRNMSEVKSGNQSHTFR